MPGDAGQRALVVVGTGMLAGASRWLAAQGWAVTLAARRPEALAQEIGAAPLALDWYDRDSAQAVLAALSPGFAMGVIWLHDDAVWLARAAEYQLAPYARVIRVHGALSADPKVHASREPDPRPGIWRQSVILGWHPDPAARDRKRWLTDAEISGGLIEALETPDPSPLIVGTRAGP